MPEVNKRTLLVVCDTHHCLFIDVGNHTLLVADTVTSTEAEYSDNEGRYQSPAAGGKGGMVGGMIDMNPVEKNRLREFAHAVSDRVAKHVAALNIEELYISAPGKFLSVLQEHLSAPIKKKLTKTLDGNFVKEPARDTLLRFKPELSAAMKKLREQENYSPRNQPPKNGN